MTATASLSVPTRPSQALNVSLWAAQLLLGIAFAVFGFMKLTTPIAELSQAMDWVASAPGLVRFIGAAELAGAIGVIVPALTRIQPRLTVLAALGLTAVMVLAFAFHLVRGELTVLGVPLVIGGLAAFVAWGRSRKAPIEPRT